MYELNTETNKIDFTHNPFSMPQGGMDALLNKDPLDIYAYQYDIVCNGVELSSGAVRNHNPDIMKKAFEIAGYGEETVKAKFGALYTAFSYGAPPHAGMAPGVDRMIMLLADEKTIREGHELLLAVSREMNVPLLADCTALRGISPDTDGTPLFEIERLTKPEWMEL
jgi:aspartyl-tRNA synthetase